MNKDEIKLREIIKEEIKQLNINKSKTPAELLKEYNDIHREWRMLRIIEEVKDKLEYISGLGDDFTLELSRVSSSTRAKLNVLPGDTAFIKDTRKLQRTIDLFLKRLNKII